MDRSAVTKKYRLGLVVALTLLAALLCVEIVREMRQVGGMDLRETPPEAPASGRLEEPLGPRPAARRVDYSDVVGMDEAPLIPLQGLSHYHLSPNFTIGDFAARDSAEYVRISPKLVDALETVRAHLGVALYVSSGYRHTGLNASEHVGGAEYSQHIAGRAADVASPDATPLEIAAAALEALGCTVGIGLGETFVHVDVRGELAAWTSAGAAMDDETFRAWAPLVCSGADPEEIEAALRPAEEPPVPVYAGQYDAEMRAYARLMNRREEPGLVLLDIEPTDSIVSPYRLSSMAPDDSLVAALGLVELVEGSAGGRYFVFVVRNAGEATFGVQPL